MTQLSNEVLSALTSQISGLVQAQINNEIEAGNLVRASDVVASRADLEDREARMNRIKQEVEASQKQMVERMQKVAQGMVALGSQAKTYLHKTLLVTQHGEAYEPSEEALSSLASSLGDNVDREVLRAAVRTFMRDEIERITAPPTQS